ncbi:MAG: hypothetical protein L0H63_13620 [Nitrococcus sp.]|nr:hypothetical protein [Nitrococcus sp.]
MKFSALVGLSALLVATMAISGCRSRYEWHQKLTVVVETPDGIVSGNAVQAAKYEKNVWFAAVNGAPSQIYLRGEAVVIPIAKDKYLFMLLPKGSLAYEMYTLSSQGTAGSRIAKMLSVRRRPIEVPLQDAPPFAMFGDIEDPNSAHFVNVEGKYQEANGFSIKSVSLEITNEAVTDGAIDDILPWLNDQKIMKNPHWSTLSKIAKETISRLRSVEWRDIHDY